MQALSKPIFAAAVLCVAQVVNADGDAAAGKTKSASCAACHGTDGNGAGNPLWPKLAGQIPEYLVKQLSDFKSGVRKDPLMLPQAVPLSPKDMADLAAYYASQKIKPGTAQSQELARVGERIYRGGNAKTGLSACMSCHGPSGHGIPPRFPRVSAQTAGYTEKQLLAFKSAKRAQNGDIMTRIAFRMSEVEIKAVSEYMSGLH